MIRGDLHKAGEPIGTIRIELFLLMLLRNAISLIKLSVRQFFRNLLFVPLVLL